MLPERIDTDRLALRPFTLRDAAAVFEYSGDPEWGRFQSGPSPFSEKDADESVAGFVLRDRATRPTWAITRDDRVVGVVALTFEADHRIAVVGYGIHKKLWGRGLCVEATRAVITRAFEHYEQLRRIRAHTDARNAISARVLQKLGFTHEGTLRANQFAKGEFVDDAVYGLLREEWSG